MATSLLGNVVLDIYRGYTPNAPYFPTNGVPDVPAVNGFLRHHMKCGRFGFGTKSLYWTHLLYVDLGTDIRDAYDTQADPNRTDTQGDTVIISNYPRAGTCTAFYVVLVQRIGQSGPNAFFKVYLDRCQTRFQACKQPTCCSGSQLPATLHLTVTSASTCLADIQSTPLLYDAASQTWLGHSTGSNCQWTLTLACNPVNCLNNDQTGSWQLTFYYPPANNGGAFCCDRLQFGSTCKPVLIRCHGTMTFLAANFTATITQ